MIGCALMDWDHDAFSLSPSNARTNWMRMKACDTNDRRFRCMEPGCGKAFPRAFALRRHARIHSGARPYLCEFEGCMQSFNTSGNLSRHKRLHSGEKAYVCKVRKCSKRFSTNDKLQEHLQTHDAHRPRLDCTEQDCRLESVDCLLQAHTKSHAFTLMTEKPSRTSKHVDAPVDTSKSWCLGKLSPLSLLDSMETSKLACDPSKNRFPLMMSPDAQSRPLDLAFPTEPSPVASAACMGYLDHPISRVSWGQYAVSPLPGASYARLYSDGYDIGLTGEELNVVLELMQEW